MGSSSSKPARKLAKEATQAVSRQSEAAGAQAASAASAAARAARPAPTTSPSSSSSSTSQSGQYGSGAGSSATRGDPGTAPATSSYDPQYAPSRTDATRQQQAQASETKTQDIMRDASDPQLLQNLARLGAVNVPKHSTNYQPTDQMLRILAARSKASLDPSDHTAGSATTPTAASSSRSPNASTAASERVSATTLSLLLDDRKHCETHADLEKLAVEYDLPLATIQQLARHFNSPTMGDEIREDERERERDDTAPAKFKALWVEPQLGAAKQQAIGP
ncbi:uncharacterized protein PFL1_04894 [Pseudozyma flocculosa PF-1]|uniref:Uncharacterized protein n=2 Tax=Pseudozyma flocculosa TaxID=84751 RepID=A0A5C3F767_9BASI|nr:uncharacterized protein PFL1_04894 [Pseudozyma flocculosa PF-1]EPQ27757.1 hypothetical protein PFL1_04894 [Pseudozyma flocculosa PF-1]SPO39101.1 uncharacterized protein PSFLO_04580 [Pseudozyma flocculosa]